MEEVVKVEERLDAMEMEVERMKKVKKEVRNEVCKTKKWRCIFIVEVTTKISLLPFATFDFSTTFLFLSKA